jgi:hypothetical protein
MTTSRARAHAWRVIPLAVALATAAALTAAGTPAGAVARTGSTVRPGARTWDSWAYYPARHDIVLFGGNAGHGQSVGGRSLGDTWTWNAEGWTHPHPAASPSPRTGAAMAYDFATHQLVLFGGSTGPESGFQADTWTWNGTTWAKLQPATSPPARHNGDLFYDAAQHELILFGGYDGSYLNDTWAWNGTTWTQLQPATSPPPRDTESLVYDPATKTAIMFGGFNGERLADTWNWNGTTWAQLQPSTSPGVVSTSWQATYDGHSRQLLLFGGDPGNAPFSDRTWVWNGTTWVQQQPTASPVGRAYGALTYDVEIGQAVMFGGSIGSRDPNTVWEWTGTLWQQPPVVLGRHG